MVSSPGTAQGLGVSMRAVNPATKIRLLIPAALVVGALLLCGCRPSIHSGAQVQLLRSEAEVERALREPWLLLPLLGPEGHLFLDTALADLIHRVRPSQSLQLLFPGTKEWNTHRQEVFQAYSDSIHKQRRIPSSLLPALTDNMGPKFVLTGFVYNVQLLRPGAESLQRKLVVLLLGYDRGTREKVFEAKASAHHTADSEKSLAPARELLESALLKLMDQLPYSTLGVLQPGSAVDF